ncbi:hypothetical protein BKA70DRAFT_1573784 [Coprinopsis sp. MPI-PUGE-AT-0042]|nr:hypothetical protein BKA70DRAFT_1573784 [Coprinopsis sp. MPI-PUGE-AT-0042]
MRWSLILATFAVLPSLFLTFGYSLVVPSYSEGFSDLVPRVKRAGRNAVAGSSKDVRAAAIRHKWVYITDPTNIDNSALRRPCISDEDRGARGKWQADHILEVQIVTKHLERNGIDWNRDLSSQMKSQVRKITNGKANVTPITGRMNAQKGQFYKSGTEGKPSHVTEEATRQYIELSFGTAKEIAGQLDQLYNNSKKIQDIIKKNKKKDANYQWETVLSFLIKAHHHASGQGLAEGFFESPKRPKIKSFAAGTRKSARIKSLKRPRSHSRSPSPGRGKKIKRK